MSLKSVLIIATVSLLIGGALGRYFTPVKEVTKTIEVEKVDKKVDTNIVTHTVTKKEVLPNGTQEEETTTDSETKRDSDTVKDATTAIETTKESGGARKTSISVLGGYRSFDFTSPLIGGIVSRPVFGLLIVGVWGLSNATYGVSVGLEF